MTLQNVPGSITQSQMQVRFRAVGFYTPKCVHCISTRMVERRLSDGKRIAQLLASEIEGLGGPLDPAAVVAAEPDVEPTVDGAFAYDVAVDATDSETVDASERIAAVFVQPERVRVEFAVDQQRAAQTASEEDLRVRPKASQPPRTLVFVEDGAQVKRVSRVFAAVLEARE